MQALMQAGSGRDRITEYRVGAQCAPSHSPEQVTTILGLESEMRPASDSAEKPANTTEKTAPRRAQASCEGSRGSEGVSTPRGRHVRRRAAGRQGGGQVRSAAAEGRARMQRQQRARRCCSSAC